MNFRCTLLAVCAAALMYASPAQAVERDWVRLGSAVTFNDLVEEPDISIQFVAWDQSNKVATLMLSRVNSAPGERAQIDMRQSEPHDIVLKRVCSPHCRVFVVTLRWDDQFEGRLYIHYSIGIRRAYSS